DVIAGRDVLEYCPSGLGDTHEATAVHYVFRRDARRQYTDVVACRTDPPVAVAVGPALQLREACQSAERTRSASPAGPDSRRSDGRRCAGHHDLASANYC